MTGFIYRCGGESIFPVPTIWRTPLKYLFENVCCLAYYKLPLILLLFSGSEWGKALILVKHNVGEDIHPVLLTHTLEFGEPDPVLYYLSLVCRPVQLGKCNSQYNAAFTENSDQRDVGVQCEDKNILCKTLKCSTIEQGQNIKFQ